MRKLFTKKPLGKHPVGMQRRWQDNVMIHLKERVCEDGKLKKLVQDHV